MLFWDDEEEDEEEDGGDGWWMARTMPLNSRPRVNGGAERPDLLFWCTPCAYRRSTWLIAVWVILTWTSGSVGAGRDFALSDEM